MFEQIEGISSHLHHLYHPHRPHQLHIPVCSSESLLELMFRVLRVFERREGIESRSQEDMSNNSKVGEHLDMMMMMMMMMMMNVMMMMMMMMTMMRILMLVDSVIDVVRKELETCDAL